MPDRRALSGDRNQCPECSEYFNSTGAFSKHRVGDYARDANGRSMRRCLTPDEMTAKGMAQNDAGFWTHGLMTDADRARTTGNRDVANSG